MQLRSLLEMENQLETIRLTDMTKRRANVPLYRQEAVMNPKPEEKETEEEVDPDVNLLKNLDISDAIVPSIQPVQGEATTPIAWTVCNKHSTIQASASRCSHA